MKKQYNFLAGLPRSGNTVLSSILSQNPEIHSGPLSPVCGFMWDLHSQLGKMENVVRQEDLAPSERIISGIIDSYYENTNELVVFDREKGWFNPDNLEMIRKYITPTPKVVVTVRPVLEVLASLLLIRGENGSLREEMVSNNWWFRQHMSYEDNACDYLMRPWGNLDSSLLGAYNLQKQPSDSYHLIEYDDLISKPEEVMKNLYNYLELDVYEHNYDKIIKPYKDHDDRLGLSENLHAVRPKLEKTSFAIEDVLSDYIIEKYSNLEHWRINP